MKDLTRKEIKEIKKKYKAECEVFEKLNESFAVRTYPNYCKKMVSICNMALNSRPKVYDTKKNDLTDQGFYLIWLPNHKGVQIALWDKDDGFVTDIDGVGYETTTATHYLPIPEVRETE